VADLLAQLAALGRRHLPSPDPTAYCQARQRLPVEVLVGLLGNVVEQMKALPQSTLTWLGRRVWIADGTTVSMPTNRNYRPPFPSECPKTRLRFPVARLEALFCWATGASWDGVIGSLHTAELPLFRKLWHHFKPGDVVLCDRAYCAYADMVRLLQRGVFCVFRLHQGRNADFRRASGSARTTGSSPGKRPRWLKSMGISREELAALPETLIVRMVRITSVPKGFRSRTIVVATTLLDPIETPATRFELYTAIAGWRN